MSTTMPAPTRPVATRMDNTYARPDVSGSVHRNRLRGVVKAIAELPLADSGVAADFSPSNGYLLRGIQDGAFAGKQWEWDSFEVDDTIAHHWNQQGMPNTTFYPYDLVHPTPVPRMYGLVVSIGMFEHILDWKPGIPVLLDSCKPGGHLVVGVPNECGFAGMVKFLGRDALRRNAYDDFFAERSKLDYFWTLLSGGPISAFRKPKDWYLTHIGWDIRPFRDDLLAACQPPEWTLLSHKRTLGGANWLWVFRKAG